MTDRRHDVGNDDSDPFGDALGGSEPEVKKVARPPLPQIPQRRDPAPAQPPVPRSDRTPPTLVVVRPPVISSDPEGDDPFGDVLNSGKSRLSIPPPAVTDRVTPLPPPSTVVVDASSRAVGQATPGVDDDLNAFVRKGNEDELHHKAGILHDDEVEYEAPKPSRIRRIILYTVGALTIAGGSGLLLGKLAAESTENDSAPAKTAPAPAKSESKMPDGNALICDVDVVNAAARQPGEIKLTRCTGIPLAGGSKLIPTPTWRDTTMRFDVKGVKANGKQMMCHGTDLPYPNLKVSRTAVAKAVMQCTDQ